MPTTWKRGTSVAVAMLGVLISGAITGCGNSEDDEPRRGSASATPEPGQSETGVSTPTPATSGTRTSPNAPTAVPGSPEAALLSGGELPPLNEASPWTDGKTDVPGATSFGLCQHFDILSVGAMSAVQRAYTGASGDKAGQQIAEFPDAQNTVRASKVLEAWHHECKGQVKGTRVKVRPITDVPVSKGKGWWYLVSYNRGGAGHFHSFGVTTTGNRMTLLAMDHEGQDHIYESGQDPMELAVKAASAKMG